MAGCAGGRPSQPWLYTWPEPVLLSRDLALGVTTCPWPGSHGATSWCRGHPCMVQRGQPERERGQSLEPGLDHWAQQQVWAFCTKETPFTMKRKYVIMGWDYHVSVCQGSRGGCEEGFTIIGFNGPKKCQSRKPKSAHFLLERTGGFH